MKNLIVIILAVFLATSVVLAPTTSYAQSTSTAALELQLNTAQKQLIVLLNKRIDMLRGEVRIALEQRLRSLQLELVTLLQKQIILLRAQVNSK